MLSCKGAFLMRITPAAAQKKLKKAVRALRRGEEAPDAAALGEHYLMLSAALLQAKACLRRQGRAPLTPLWEACCAFAVTGEPAAPGPLAVFFGPCGLSLSQVGALGTLLPGAFAAAAVLGIGADAPAGETRPFDRAVRQIFRLREMEYEALFGRVCAAQRMLLGDETFRLSDPETREACRKAVWRLAHRQSVPETEAAARFLRRGWAAAGPEALQERRRGGAFFLLLQALFPAAVSALGVWACRPYAEGFRRSPVWLVLIAALLWGPVYAALAPVFRAVRERLWPPYFLPSLDPENPEVVLPRTLVTVSALLPPAGEAAKFAGHLAALMASHSGSPAAVLALVDLKTADVPERPSDEADIAALRREIDRLNGTRGGFVLAVRGRVYSPTEDEYTGYERKRGAVEALVRLLTDGGAGFDLLCGDTKALSDVTYLLALDSDTELPFETLRRLLCVAAHPANRARFGPSGALCGGYGCFAPRAEVSVESAGATVFSRLMAMGGVSAYARRTPSRDMDLFGAASFSGKGLIDVRAYRAACVDVFPAGRVLSHDILEGGLLRTAFVSSVAVTESFPASPASYYRRQGRWVRGDVQNLRFAFRAVNAARGVRLPGLTRLQVAENVLRALLPLTCLAALVLSVFSSLPAAVLLFCAGALGASSEGLFAAAAVLLRQGAFGFSRVYHSPFRAAGTRALLRAGLSFCFLPLEAAVNARAAGRAVFRLLVSRRRTLEWTTAAEAESGGRRAMVFPALTGVLAALALSFGRPIHIAAAAALLTALPFALSVGGRRPARGKALSVKDREALNEYAAAAWRYFETYAGEEDRFLPPDNVQETPVRRTAHRTSPTNIGLYLLCCLAAADLSLISPRQFAERLGKALDSAALLRRWNGLLYNWYDTRSLEPLSPAFVSSVDCGNFLVCLTALKEGLREYEALGPAFAALRQRIEKELAGAHIETLYSPQRRLFSVGAHLPAGELSDSYYDCYMSEARLTSYYAAAKRLVGVSHWAAPDRSFLRHGRRTAAASYGGTMFEYFMPALFLPTFENTYACEGLRGCLYEQKRRVRGTPKPWGVSESGYYAFDGDMNYRYRAHGLRALALRRSPCDDNVYAPYAAFLALPADARGAVKNLRRFMALGAFGVCGFYEAVDFSSRALREDYMVVRSYMAHHLGMSMVACVNALRGDLFVRRFLRDPEMAGAVSLLKEKIPLDAPVHRPVGGAAPKRPPAPRVSLPGAFREAALFSGGESALVCDKNGSNLFLSGHTSLFAFSDRARGLCAAARVNGRWILPAEGETGLSASCFSARRKTEGALVRTAFALVEPGALAVPVNVRNLSAKACETEFAWYLEPLVLPLFSPNAHPAYADMGLRVEYEKSLGALLVRRVGNACPCFAVGLSDLSPISYMCDRESLLGRDPARGSPFEAFPPLFSGGTAFTLPGVAVKTAARLQGGEKKEKVLLVCPAADRAGALAMLSRLRRTRLPRVDRAVKNPFPPETAAPAERFLRAVFFGARDPAVEQASAGNTAPASALWEKGISGDLPVIRAHTDGLPPAYIAALLRTHRLLAFAGIRADLVLLTAQAAGYENGAVTALRRLCAAAGCAESDRPGGVRVLSADGCSVTFLSALEACPGVCFPCAQPLSAPPVPPPAKKSAPLFSGENGFVPHGYFIAAPPPRPWSHTLSNPVFGTLVTAGSLGFTWALNARLNQITPWHNDPTRPFPGETLLYSGGGEAYDCVSGASAYFLDDAAVFGARCGEACLRITVQTDAAAMKKRIRVAYSGAREGDRLVYRIRPLLAEREESAHWAQIRAENGALFFENPANAAYRGTACVYADRDAAAAAEYRAGSLAVPLAPGGGEVCFYMIWAAAGKALAPLRALPFVEPRPLRRELRLRDRDAARFANALLLHEACDCRLLARTGFWQCSGAWGFRDQLQDAVNLAGIAPARAAVQIFRCAAVQFPEGDVLHWFHAPVRPRLRFSGVRTRCSDDLLWLPFAAAEYYGRTGDLSVFGREIACLEGAPLGPGERERYADYYPGSVREPLYGHCLRALRRALRFGRHGLPLMLGGDWNDSFGEVGLRGQGESVWLGMFAALTCARFGGAAAAYGDRKTARALAETAETLKAAVYREAFNGTYFLRGFYDSGAPLGAPGSGACRIDLLPQAFASFAGIGAPEERRRALSAAFSALFSEEYGTLRLFYPPFGETGTRAGYVNDYPPGVRENAGQYTHAAVWFYMALKKEGMEAEARAVLRAILPNARSADGFGGRFLNEPYALSADVGMAPGLEGRGGWSLYTGAAGWLWRALSDESEGKTP